jgi:radical SAM superfamily enzyme YgiQ (UPF0313 family)
MAFKNVLLLTFPKIALEAPPLAPALLAEICKQNNVKCNFLDCNLDFFQQLHGSIKHEILELYAEGIKSQLSKEAEQWLNNYFTSLVNRCQTHDLIGISVFSHHSVPLVQRFLENHRHQITANIVVGGAGISTPMKDSIGEKFYGFLKRKKLIDYWIMGEADVAFANLITQKDELVGVNTHEVNHLEDFTHVLTPNFDLFDLDSYRYNNKRLLGVEGSRGCVKRCTFCDIQNFWGRFKYKNGKLLAEELLMLQEKYNIDHFWFNDSLINGSLKAFRDFITHLAKNRPPGLTWSSQAIVRPKSSKDEEDFALLEASGCETLAVGLETFSQQARFHMGKKFTDEDLDHFLLVAQKYNIRLFLLLIVGYPTETQADFEHALRQLDRYQNLSDDGTIAGVRIGNTMSLIPGTPIYDMQKQIGIKLYDERSPARHQWMLGENTLDKRIEWRVKLEDHARSLGYNCADNEAHAENMMLELFKHV